MAQVETIEINGDTSGFQKQIEALNARIEELEKTLGAAGNEAQALGKQGSKLAAGFKKAFNGLKSTISAPFKLAKGAVNGLGSALKGLGLGVVIGLVSKLTESFAGNQVVADSLNKVFTAVGLVLGKIVEGITSVIGEQAEMNGGFDATKKVIGGLISGALNLLVGAIQTIQLVVQSVQLAWEQSVFGDGDPETIKKLTASITETKEELKKTGEAIVDSGKAIVTNFVEAAQEVASTATAVIKKVTTSIQEIEFDEVLDQAEKLVELQKAAALADVERMRIQLEYQNREEQLRQLRDDTSRNIEERIKANQDLLTLLEEQAAEEEKQIKIKIAAARATYNMVKSNENLVALQQAELELTDLNERLQGQKSEALVNQVGLTQELNDMQRSAAENQLEVQKLAQEGELALLRNARARLQEELRIAAETFNAKKAFLEQEIALYAEGTAQRVEAENQLNLLKQEYANNEKRINNDLRLQNQEINAAAIQLAKDTFSAIGAISSAFAKDDEKSKRRQFEIQKKLSLANAVMSGIESVQNAFKTAAGSPITEIFPPYPFIQAGLAGAFALAQVQQIRKTQYQSPTSSTPSTSTGGGGGVPSVTPSFNVVGQSGINQLATSIGGQMNRPVRAYVVGGDVTSSQELERKRVQTASFG